MTEFIQEILETAGSELPEVLSELIDIFFSFTTDIFLNFFAKTIDNFTAFGNILFNFVFDRINLDSADFILFFIGGIFTIFLLRLIWHFISNLF